MNQKFIKWIFSLLIVTGWTNKELFSQTRQIQMETIKNERTFDSQILTEYLIWGDKKVLSILEKLNDEEFNHEFNELSGNIHSKTAHILSIYEFFIKILEGNPDEKFPDLDYMTRSELIAKWKNVVAVWPKLVNDKSLGLYALPLAGNQRVDVSDIYFDAMAHSIHHRAQLLTFVRLLGKTKEEVSPSETNTDYIMYLFTEKREHIYPPSEQSEGK